MVEPETLADQELFNCWKGFIEMSISKQRIQEILTELQCASYYFDKLVTEIEREPTPSVEGADWQTARLVYASIGLLQWHLQSVSRNLDAGFPNQAMTCQEAAKSHPARKAESGYAERINMNNGFTT